MRNLFHTETQATDSQKVLHQSHSDLPSIILDDPLDDNVRGPSSGLVEKEELRTT